MNNQQEPEVSFESLESCDCGKIMTGKSWPASHVCGYMVCHSGELSRVRCYQVNIVLLQKQLAIAERNKPRK